MFHALEIPAQQGSQREEFRLPNQSPSAPALAAAQTVAWQSINSIRVLSMDAVEQANSGHPGTPMALAPAAYVLWSRFLHHHPQRPDWPDRDRFVLSCGHASMLLYSLLYLSGYDLSLDEIKHFRQWGSKTPGHPERGHTPGVETTTGPLGQGVGNAVGMAIAERLLAERFNVPGHTIVDHRVWGFASDGDLMEGVASEAASLAGHLRLGKLKLIYDDNHITIDGTTALSFSEDVGARFEAYGWHVERVNDGNDLTAIEAALDAAARETARPSLVILRTIIADPAPTKRDTSAAHGAPLGKDEIQKTKDIMGWPQEPFYVPEGALRDMRKAVDRGAAWVSEWQARYDAYRAALPDQAKAFEDAFANRLPAGWEASLPNFEGTTKMATRRAGGMVLNALSQSIPNLLGGSADLGGSTGTTLKQGGALGPTTNGRQINWGVREHAMGSCMNGIAAHGGYRAYGSTFLVFSDYMKPTIRLAALMKVPTIYIFTHDSIGVGEDGPTHQPIEHLAMLRGIPGLVVLRPADAVETRDAWRAAIERIDGPTALILCRQDLPVLDRSLPGTENGTSRGGYILSDPVGGPQAILIATGSEVSTAVTAAKKLSDEGIRIRVVSLPSWELFSAQPKQYRDEVLPPALRARVSIEAAEDFGWLKFVTEDGESLALNHFGASAPAERLYVEFGLSPDHAVAAIQRVLARRSS